MAAIDDSRDLEYLSIVIGEKDKIDSIVNTLPSSFTHMTQLDPATKLAILRGFHLNGNLQICCIKFGYSLLKEKYKMKSKEIESRKSMQKFYRNLSLEAKNKWRSLFKNFLYKNRIYLEDLVFEVDNDVIREILKHSGISYCRPNSVHKLADCIVHANYKGWDIHGVDEYNTDIFKNEFCNKFLKRCFR